MKEFKYGWLILLSLFFIFPPAVRAADDDYDKILDRGLRSNEPYSYALSKKALSDSENRIRLLQKAARLSPDLPAAYFELSKASLPNIFASFNYMIKGIKAYRRNFWWSLSLFGLLYVSLLVSLVLSLAAVVLIRLTRELPLITHDVGEDRIKLLMPVMLVALSFIGPVFFIAGTLSLIGLYLRKPNKLIAYIALFFLVLSPLFLHVANLLFSASSPELRAIVSVNEGKDNKYALSVLKGREDFASMFSYALALKREGHYKESIAVYESIPVKTPDPRLYTNLGNVYVTVGQPELAKKQYKKALKTNPSAVTFYNLSQVYRDALDFQTGDGYFLKATELDRDLVSRFTAITSTNPNRFVIDETLSTADFWSIADRNRKELINPYTTTPYLVSLIAVFIFVLSIVIDRKMGNRAFRCSRCDTVSCHKYTGVIQGGGHMCPDCYNSTVKLVDMDPKERISKLLESHERKGKSRNLIKVLSFAPPGIAQIYSDRVLTGFLLLWLFIFAIVVLVLNPLLSTGLAVYSHWWLNPPLIILTAALYLASSISVNRRLHRGWL